MGIGKNSTAIGNFRRCPQKYLLIQEEFSASRDRKKQIKLHKEILGKSDGTEFF